jgi:DNA-binding GntR family transcriptional regulator
MMLERTVTREKVKELIIQRIVDGTCKPGERIVELRLVHELGVSQGPVREALRDLEAMGFIDTEPYKGARVRELSRDELAESYPVRAALEELAGQLATARADTDLLGRLDAEIQGMRQTAADRDQRGLLKHDSRFHELIVEASGNRVLLDAWSTMRIEMFTMVSLVTSQLDLAAIANTHGPILDALRQGDPCVTGKVMREHIATFGDLLTGDRHD